MSDRNLPVVLCESVSAATWRFWCPFCRKYHTHGAGEGHRAAHCINLASPFVATGYLVRLAPRSRRTA